VLNSTNHSVPPILPRVGDPMPDLVLRGLDERPFPLSQLRGTRALIFMWASW
jgi:hypothetical protein